MMRIGLICLFFLSQTILVWSQATEPADENMVFVKGGVFQMGKDSEKRANYAPAHQVRVNSFLMDKHEVTNGEYIEFCKATGHKLPEFWNTAVFRSGQEYLNYPVVGVSLWDAWKYATWTGKRLPTEAEWEYAARGGLIDNNFPNGNEWLLPKAKQDSQSWENLIHPVEQHAANAYGLFDMGGNVWEWVADKYAYSYYSENDSINPKGPEQGHGYVIRGGSWHSGAMCKRVYFRKGLPGNWSDFAVGFRCIKDVD